MPGSSARWNGVNIPLVPGAGSISLSTEVTSKAEEEIMRVGQIICKLVSVSFYRLIDLFIEIILKLLDHELPHGNGQK